jgi:hypothetical protein
MEYLVLRINNHDGSTARRPGDMASRTDPSPDVVPSSHRAVVIVKITA